MADTATCPWAAGDELVIFADSYLETSYRCVKVERLTKTLLITDSGHRFKLDAYRSAEDKMHFYDAGPSSRAQVVTRRSSSAYPALMAKAFRSQGARQAQAAGYRWSHLDAKDRTAEAVREYAAALRAAADTLTEAATLMEGGA